MVGGNLLHKASSFKGRWHAQRDERIFPVKKLSPRKTKRGGGIYSAAAHYTHNFTMPRLTVPKKLSHERALAVARLHRVPCLAVFGDERGHERERDGYEPLFPAERRKPERVRYYGHRRKHGEHGEHY